MERINLIVLYKGEATVAPCSHVQSRAILSIPFPLAHMQTYTYTQCWSHRWTHVEDIIQANTSHTNGLILLPFVQSSLIANLMLLDVHPAGPVQAVRKSSGEPQLRRQCVLTDSQADRQEHEERRTWVIGCCLCI